MLALLWGQLQVVVSTLGKAVSAWMGVLYDGVCVCVRIVRLFFKKTCMSSHVVLWGAWGHNRRALGMVGFSKCECKDMRDWIQVTA